MSSDYADWKLQNLDPLKWWLSKLSKDQLTLLDEVKTRFNWRIDGFSQTKKDELQTKIDMHISNRARLELLEKYHADIVNKTEYLESYRDILDRETCLINDDNFNEFIMSFEVVGLSSPYVNDMAEVKAIEYLENVATLNIIEYLKDRIIESEILGNHRFKDSPEWQKVLAKLANRFKYNFPTVKFTIIFHFMKRKGILPKEITQLKYMEFVRNKYLNNRGFKKMDFTSYEYALKVNPHESKLNNILETP